MRPSATTRVAKVWSGPSTSQGGGGGQELEGRGRHRGAAAVVEDRVGRSAGRRRRAGRRGAGRCSAGRERAAYAPAVRDGGDGAGRATGRGVGTGRRREARAPGRPAAARASPPNQSSSRGRLVRRGGAAGERQHQHRRPPSGSSARATDARADGARSRRATSSPLSRSGVGTHPAGHAGFILRETGPDPGAGSTRAACRLEDAVLEFDVLVEIPKGSRNKYEVDHAVGPDPARPDAVHLDAVPRRLRLHREHPRPRRRPAGRAGAADRASRRSPAA